jgi:hypothetical protein
MGVGHPAPVPSLRHPLVDAAKVATVSIDGVAKLTRNNFTTNGTIAIGDQTNDANIDGAVRIKSVERLCPRP